MTPNTQAEPLQVVTDLAALKQARALVSAEAEPVVVVMTMGALHEGHAALLRAARKSASTVIATIFVNPLQFGAGEDLAKYPRTFEADLAFCEREGVNLVFAPTPAAMYPDGKPSVQVMPGPLGDVWEGASRPGHFGGMLTVVLKLLNLTRPDFAFFGEKDYQQLVLIRRMARDLNLPTTIVGVPTVREPDGLALSSRNRYLNPAQRGAAGALFAALQAGARAGESGADAVLVEAQGVLAAAPGIELEYLALTDQELGAAPSSGAARLLVAARVGTTRLIDNVAVVVRGSS